MSALVPDILILSLKNVQNMLTDDVIHSTQYNIKCINKATSYLSQFAAEIIETCSANSCTGNSPTAI